MGNQRYRVLTHSHVSHLCIVCCIDLSMLIEIQVNTKHHTFDTSSLGPSKFCKNQMDLPFELCAPVQPPFTDTRHPKNRIVGSSWKFSPSDDNVLRDSEIRYKLHHPAVRCTVRLATWLSMSVRTNSSRLSVVVCCFFSGLQRRVAEQKRIGSVEHVRRFFGR